VDSVDELRLRVDVSGLETVQELRDIFRLGHR
jgi:hypothetical protein